ncbi:ATP-binding domain-containing protein, partial [Chloroflexota bacterium]
YVNSRQHLRENHFVRLEANCRQESDPKILEFADLFVAKNRYYPALLKELKAGGQKSPGLFVAYWKDKDELFELLDERLKEVFKAEGVFNAGDLDSSFNRLFGLFDNGYVPKNDPQSLRDSLDTLQLMTPYTAGYSGTLGLNQEWARQRYKQSSWRSRSRNSVFGHSEKVIRIQNWYWGKTLKLSNGSIGMVCDNKRGRRWYFPDAERPIAYVDDEENFELAYAISVHKSQGSEFKNCFFVMPRKTWLLSREIVYTALTRSKANVHLFIQKADGFDPLEYAIEHTSVLLRNSSLLQDPWDARKHLNPEGDVWLKSKVEYIIYRSLAEHRIRGELDFTYEQPLSIPGKERPIKPDFTIDVGDRTYLWEHLGMLDQRDYATKWQERKSDIERAGHLDSLITTDDINGISQHRLDAVIEDVISGKLGGTGEARFSNHHYPLEVT